MDDCEPGASGLARVDNKGREESVKRAIWSV